MNEILDKIVNAKSRISRLKNGGSLENYSHPAIEFAVRDEITRDKLIIEELERVTRLYEQLFEQLK